VIPRSAGRRFCSSLLGGVVALLVTASGCGAVSDPSDAGSGTQPPGGTTTEFAPYFFSWAWGNSSYAFTSLVDMKAKGGPSSVTLAFVLSGDGCNTTTDLHAQRADIEAYVAAGGHVKASFGGASGTYLEYACATSGELAAALGRFVDDTGITDLDFDLEQHAQSSNPAINRLRAAALSQLQTDKHVRISFTLPAAPTGLLQDSLDILQAAVDAKVAISIINGMTLDYGDGTDLSTTPIRSVDGIAQQVRALYPALGIDQAYRLVGATAMIGKNDDDETFTRDDARLLIAHAQQHKLGLVSFWAIHRDQVCPPGDSIALCSRANTATFDFSAIFAGVNSAR